MKIIRNPDADESEFAPMAIVIETLDEFKALFMLVPTSDEHINNMFETYDRYVNMLNEPLSIDYASHFSVSLWKKLDAVANTLNIKVRP